MFFPLQVRVRSVLAAASAALVPAIGLGAAESADSALFAPIDMEVVDVDATVTVATNAGERLPIVVAHDPAVALEVAGGFDSTFAQTRVVFLERMLATFGVAVLDASVVGEQLFRDFRADFQEGNTLFPVSPALAQSWARGFDGEPVRERIARLLQAFEREQLIGEIRPASSVFVVTRGADAGARAWGEVAPRARSVEPTAVLTPQAAGELLRRMNDPLDRAAGGYLSGLLRVNVVEDRYLTGLLLRERLGSSVASRMIARGAKLSEAGQPVDAWAALALAQLAHLGIQPLDAAPILEASPTSPADRAESTHAEPTESSSSAGWWIAGGIVLLVLGAGSVGVWVLMRRHRPLALQVTPGGPSPTTGGEAMIPHLARELRDRLVRALFTQRTVLLANEQAASRRVQEMEERLARLQPAIAERIRSYEQRIDALEKEIAERDAETRDLLRAKLVLARKELDAEISRNRLDWN